MFPRTSLRSGVTTSPPAKIVRRSVVGFVLKHQLKALPRQWTASWRYLAFKYPRKRRKRTNRTTRFSSTQFGFSKQKNFNRENDSRLRDDTRFVNLLFQGRYFILDVETGSMEPAHRKVDKRKISRKYFRQLPDDRANKPLRIRKNHQLVAEHLGRFDSKKVYLPLQSYLRKCVREVQRTPDDVLRSRMNTLRTNKRIDREFLLKFSRLAVGLIINLGRAPLGSPVLRYAKAYKGHIVIDKIPSIRATRCILRILRHRFSTALTREFQRNYRRMLYTTALSN